MGISQIGDEQAWSSKILALVVIQASQLASARMGLILVDLMVVSVSTDPVPIFTPYGASPSMSLYEYLSFPLHNTFAFLLIPPTPRLLVEMLCLAICNFFINFVFHDITIRSNCMIYNLVLRRERHDLQQPSFVYSVQRFCLPPQYALGGGSYWNTGSSRWSSTLDPRLSNSFP
jgi:hypothetical protein